MSEYTYDTRHAESNGLAIAGFVCSLLGIVLTAGVLSPIGLIFSLIALGRPAGRGWATAGIVLGLVGTCGWGLVWLFLAGVILAALGIGAAAVFLAMHDPDRLELTIEMAQIAEAVETEKRSSGYLPATLNSLQLESDVLTDPWGTNYVYTFVEDDPGYDVISNGPDMQPGTDDDVKLSKLDELWMNFIDVKEDSDSGVVTFRIGDRTVRVKGDEETGRVTIESGDRTINIVGNENGGQISVTHGQGDSSVDSPSTPDMPSDSSPDGE